MKKKFKLSKGEKTFLIVLVSYAAIMLLIILPNYLRKQRENLYIMTTRYKIKYEKGKWYNITNSNDYKLKKSKIYLDGEYFGEYKILYSDRFTLINDDDEIVSYSGVLFVTSGSLDLKLYDISYNEQMTYKDDEIVKEALDKIDIPQDAYYKISQKLSIDADKNNNKAYIYIINNYGEPAENIIDGIAELVPNSTGNNFSVIFMYKNEKVYIIDKKITKENDIKAFEVLDLVDIRDDGKFELIYVEGDRYNTFNDCVKLYDLTKNKEIHNFCE